MFTTQRFDNAVTKLYEAFYTNTLFPECCKQCAVGSISNASDSWKHFSDAHGSLSLNYVGKVHEMLGKRYFGYLPSEILLIEHTFLKACGYELPLHFSRKTPTQAITNETLFHALCEVLELLCNLDGISNIMDYQQSFKEVLTQTTVNRNTFFERVEV